MAENESFTTIVELAFSSADGTKFQELYKLIYRSAYKVTRNHYAAEDVAGEVLRKLWQEWKSQKVRDPSKLRSWVLQVTHNEAVDYLRKLHPGISLDHVEDFDESPLRDFLSVNCPEEIPEAYAERQEFRWLICHALSYLSEIDRACLLFRFMERMSLEEIATYHNLGKRQILRHIQKGKKEFLQAYFRLIAEQYIIERSVDR